MRLVPALILVTCVACNGQLAPDEASVASACNDACHHVFTCEGLDDAGVESSCQQVCADPGAGPFTKQCGDASALIHLFQCLDGLSCADYPADASTLPQPQWDCIEQNCP
jgi:hypothetical protein